MVHSRCRTLADGVGPNAGSVVMATGIVSVALVMDGYPGISRALLGLAGAVWITLAAVFCWRALRDRPRFGAEARSAAALTAVAGAAVLGSRLLQLGWTGAAVAMLVLACALWTTLVGRVLRSLPRRASGGPFILTVSVQSLAVLAGALAGRDGAIPLAYLALPLTAGGLILYLIVLARFDARQLLHGSGDQWICGGALAISTLAIAEITLAASRIHVLGGGGAVLQDVTIALWAAAVAWLPVLLAGELLEPRLSYHSNRWATVFPLGMYAVCSYATSQAVGLAALRTLAQAFTWIALVAWALAWLGLIRQGVRRCERMPSASPSSPLVSTGSEGGDP